MSSAPWYCALSEYISGRYQRSLRGCSSKIFWMDGTNKWVKLSLYSSASMAASGKNLSKPLFLQILYSMPTTILLTTWWHFWSSPPWVNRNLTFTLLTTTQSSHSLAPESQTPAAAFPWGPHYWGSAAAWLRWLGLRGDWDLSAWICLRWLRWKVSHHRPWSCICQGWKTTQVQINPLRAEFFIENINMYLQLISFLHTDIWHDTDSSSSCKTRTYLFYIVNVMDADVLVPQGATASATMIMAMSNRNNSIPAS